MSHRKRIGRAMGRMALVWALLLAVPWQTPRAAPDPQERAEAQLGRVFERLEAETLRLQQQLAAGLGITEPKSRLRHLRHWIGYLDHQVERDFDRLGDELAERALPAVIGERHEAARLAYRQAVDQLATTLEQIAASDDPGELEGLVSGLLAQLRAGRPPQPPIGLDDAVEIPEAEPAPQSANLRVQAAQTLGSAPSAPTADDLADQGDARQDPAIRELAEQLGHSAVAIHRWVGNHLRFIPSYGSLQGAAHTLATGRGNAFDAASLLIALLRASAIPARYVTGRIELPLGRLQNLLGDVQSAEAALGLLSQGGIPYQLVTESGAIRAVRLEHAWVEAWVDFFPSRGAIERQGERWVALDPSIKLMTYRSAQVPSADATALAAALQAGSDFDSAEGWLAALDQDAVDGALAGYRAELDARISPGAELGELLGDAGEIVALDRPVLPTGLPYRAVRRDPAVAALPEALRHRLRIELYRSEADAAAGILALGAELVLPEIAEQRLGLHFVPATAADAEALQSFLPEGELGLSQLPAEIPGYLIELDAELRLDGEVIDHAGPFTLGQGLVASLGHLGPAGLFERRIDPVAGAQYALGWDLQGGLAGPLRRAGERLEAIDPLADADAVGELFHAGLLSYLAANDLYNAWQAAAADAVLYRAPSLASLHTLLETEDLLGIPRTVRFAGVALDSPRLAVQAAGKSAPGVAPRLLRQLGQLGSALAHTVLEGLFADPEPGVSAVRTLGYALAQQKRLYTLEQPDPALLDGFDLDARLRQGIAAALGAGRRVHFNPQPASVGPWSGHGFAALDPLTGQGQWLAHGALGGAATALGLRYAASGPLWFYAALPDPDPRLDPLFGTQLEASRHLLEALLPSLEDPYAVPYNDAVGALIAATGLDLAADGRLPAVLDEALWSALTGAELDLGKLVDPQAPEVQLTAAPAELDLGASVLIEAHATDNDRVERLQVHLDGVPIDLDADGRYGFTPTAAGRYRVVALAYDPAGNRGQAETEIGVRDPADTTAPQALIQSPADGSAVTAPIEILGTATDGSFSHYLLYLREARSPQSELLARGDTPVIDGLLGHFDPSLRLNGLYQLYLEVHDLNGQVSFDEVVIRVEGERKLGHFSVTFQDLSIPLGEQTLAVYRSYDTRRSAEPLAFGHGWSVDYQNVRVHEARAPGFAWFLEQIPYGPLGLLVRYCVRPLRDNLVSVRMPDGELERFRARAVPECNDNLPILDVELAFDPLEGTHSRLEALDYHSGRLLGGQLSDPAEQGIPLDPDRYLLTTPEGYRYQLDQGFTLTRLLEPNDDYFLFSEAGITHSRGLGVQFHRDAQGRITEIIDPQGHALHYGYDPEGNLTSFTDRTGHTTEYTYLGDPAHYLDQIIDPRGIPVARNLYDEQGRLIAQIDAAGHRIEFDHLPEADLEVVRDRRGNATTYRYDVRGYVLSETNALGETTHHSYDEVGNELSRTDPLGHTQSWSYDAMGNERTATDALGHTRESQYTAYNQLSDQSRWLDAEGTEKTLTASYGYRNVDAYLRPGPLTTLTDALGQTTSFYYAIHPLTQFAGPLIAMSDADGHTTSYDNDAYGNPIRETATDGGVTETTYNANGNVLTETRIWSEEGIERRLTTTHTYDPEGRRLSSTDPLGGITRYEYDPIGKLSAETDPKGRRTESLHDARGQLLLTRYPDGSEERIDYDPNGNKIAETDRGGHTTRYRYDAADRLIETIHPDDTPLDDSDNPRVQNEYDPAGRLTAVIDERGHRTAYDYDAAGRRTSVTDPLGRTTTFEYDPWGNRTAVIDPRGYRTGYVYDLADRLIETIHPDDTPDEADNPRTQIDYDPLGRRIARTDAAGSTTAYRYDPMGRLVEVIDPLGQSTTYGYDPQGNKTTQTDAEGRVTTWEYDDLGRAIRHTLPEGQSELFEYDLAGNRIRHIDFNGRVTTYRYDDLNREIRRTHPDGTSVATTYTPTGEVDTVTDSRGVTDYDYDARGRLIRITYPDGRTLDYRYDAASNRSAVIPGAPLGALPSLPRRTWA